MFSLWVFITIRGPQKSTAAAAATAQTRLSLRVPVPALVIPAMSRMNRGELVTALQAFGETPPSKWTIPELRTRLLQLQEEHGVVTSKGKKVTDLRQHVVQLNQASKKKSVLQQYCDKLGVPINYQETIPQLQMTAMTKIYEISKPDGSDPVGFGKGAALTYDELREDKQYCQWLMKTWEEGSTCPQLSRFARWYQQIEMNPTVNTNKTDTKKTDEPNLTIKTPVKEEKAETVSSQSEATQEMVMVMRQMMMTMTEIKEELSDLHPERPRKKPDVQDEHMSQQSFEVVNRQGP